jgi:MFS family permease
MTRQAKILVTLGLMLGMALTALDTTIVGTALPSIVGKLGGITLYSWVFSAYLMTSWLVPSSLSACLSIKKIVLWHSTRFV